MITSPTNPRVKNLAALIQKARTRKQQDVFVAEAYGDYHCDDGGFDGMIFNSASRNLAPVSDILFTTTQLYDFYMSNMEYDVNMQVIGRRGEYVAVEIIP